MCTHNMHFTVFSEDLGYTEQLNVPTAIYLRKIQAWLNSCPEKKHSLILEAWNLEETSDMIK